MVEAIITLAVVCAVQSVIIASLPFLLWRFIDQDRRLAGVAKDVATLDEVVNRAIEGRHQ